MEDLIVRVCSVLLISPTRWQNLVESLPADLLARQPAPGEWSALECLEHIVDTEQVFISRIKAFQAGQDLPNFDPDTQGSQGSQLNASPSAQELVARFVRLRQDSLTLLATVTPANLDQRVRHAQLGPVTLREMLNEWAAHDFNHTVQAERALMQTFIQASGPWQSFFADHFIKD